MHCSIVYDIIIIILLCCAGQEFQAVFLSTTEPIDEDGNTRNPTKSPSDRYVFNTVLTRAKSLVVVVGSPLVLLNVEEHMIKLYGDKGRCWSTYLKSCLEHDTLIIPSRVEQDKNISEKFKEDLAIRLGASLPRKGEFQSSRRNYRTSGVNSSVSSTVSRQTSSTHHAAAHYQPKSPLQLVNKPVISTKSSFQGITHAEPALSTKTHQIHNNNVASNKQSDASQSSMRSQRQQSTTIPTQSLQEQSAATRPPQRSKGAAVRMINRPLNAEGRDAQTNQVRQVDSASHEFNVTSNKKQTQSGSATFSQTKVKRQSLSELSQSHFILEATGMFNHIQFSML